MRCLSRAAVAGAVVAVAGAGLLAGCGSSGSSSSASTTAASATDSGLVQAPPSVGPPPGAVAPLSTEPEPALGPKDVTYLNALKAAGITPGDSQAEINLAKLICESIKDQVPQNKFDAMVNAIAGTDAQAAGKQVDDAQLDALGQVYINAAKSTYCP